MSANAPVTYVAAGNAGIDPNKPFTVAAFYEGNSVALEANRLNPLANTLLTNAAKEFTTLISALSNTASTQAPGLDGESVLVARKGYGN